MKRPGPIHPYEWTDAAVLIIVAILLYIGCFGG